MVGVVLEKKPSHSWWFHSHNCPKRSPWLQSTLTELDEKTMAMLKVIEEDADSFAKRAEMYYRKRPELINMVEDFYRAHRSLAERFDQLKSESKSRSLCSSVTSRLQSQKSTSSTIEKCYDSYSDYAFESEESGESEVDDSEEQEQNQVHKGMAKENVFESEESGESEVDDPEEQEEVTQVHKEVSSGRVHAEEIMKLREEIERLKEENRVQKELLMEKDEEKREVIRQLSLSMEFLRENISLSKKALKEEEAPKKKNPFELSKIKGLFTGKLFAGSSKCNYKANLVAL